MNEDRRVLFREYQKWVKGLRRVSPRPVQSHRGIERASQQNDLRGTDGIPTGRQWDQDGRWMDDGGQWVPTQ